MVCQITIILLLLVQMVVFRMCRLEVKWQVLKKYSTDLDSNVRPDRMCLTFSCMYMSMHMHPYQVCEHTLLG